MSPGVHVGECERRTRLVSWAMALSSLFYVALALHVPVALFANFGHDDAWSWHHAETLLSGHWLGPYSQFALMKGPGYPIFLALNHALGTPVTLAHALLYSGACALLAFTLMRLTRSALFGLATVVLLQWHPMALSWDRVIRDDISAAQVLLIVACVLHCLFVKRLSRGARRRWATAAGLLCAWFWLTREDGIWIVPGLVLLAVPALVRAFERPRAAMRDAGWPAVAGVVAAVGLMACVAAVNWRHYGRFEVVDFNGSAFKSAVGALQSVRVGDAVAFVPVPEQVRDAVAANSPTFARLQPYFRGPGRGWIQADACRQRRAACDDYPGALFVWALRDAVASIGGYESPKAAASIYRQMTREIDAACAQGRLTCVRGANAFLPAITHQQWQTLPARLRAAVGLLLWHAPARPTPTSRGGIALETAMWQFTGLPRAVPDPEAGRKLVAGWFRSPDNAWLQLRCGPGDGIVNGVERRPSRDVAQYFNDTTASEIRFQVGVDASDRCALEVAEGASGQRVVALSEVDAAPVERRLAAGELYIDTVREINLCCQAPMAVEKIRGSLAKGYRVLLPVLAGAGLIAFVFGCVGVLRRRRASPLFYLAAATWCMVLCRVALLVLVDLSSFGAINVQYMQPAFPLLVVAALASLAALRIGNGRLKRGPSERMQSRELSSGDGDGDDPAPANGATNTL